MELLSNLDPLLQAFWYMAIPSSLIFILQAVMTFSGVDSMHGHYADLHGDLGGADVPFQLFSLRNLINFLLGFSWTGISFYYTIANHTLLMAFGVAVGLLFVYFFFFAIKQILKLTEDNSFKISQTLYKTAEVYLPIPGNREGAGKVIVSVNGSVHELPAVTSENKIPTGAMVRIIDVEGESTLIVEPI